MITLKSGSSAYYCSALSGLTPCIVIRLYESNKVRRAIIKLTIDADPFKIGEQLSVLAAEIAPRGAIKQSRRKSGGYYVDLFDVEMSGEAGE